MQHKYKAWGPSSRVAQERMQATALDQRLALLRSKNLIRYECYESAESLSQNGQLLTFKRSYSI